MNFEKKIAQTIRENDLLKADYKVLVAVSGGSDSVALLRVLLALGYDCDVVHCNFGLRGQESDRDEQFVICLCEKLKVRIHLKSFDTSQYASEQKISIEMAARELRYEYFKREAAKIKAHAIAVAHHIDDNAETVLLNLVRGTGIRGLCGMSYKRDLIVRPLLDVSRQEILDYLKSINQDFVTDSSNLRPDVMRNKIRLQVLPLLREMNPSIDETLNQEAKKFTDAANIYERVADDELKENLKNADGCQMLPLEYLRKCRWPETVLFVWLSKYGFNETQINQIRTSVRLHGEGRFETQQNLLLLEKDNLCLISRRALTHLPEKELTINGTEDIDDNTALEVKEFESEKGFKILKQPDFACVDAQKVVLPLQLRPLKEGDRFVPFGMKGSKLVSDFLADTKVPRHERLRQMVVTDKEKIVWLVGRRVDNRVCIDGTTKHVIMMSLVKKRRPH